MLINSISDFTLAIPTAQGSDWPAIEPFVSAADDYVQTTLIGSDLQDHIAALTTDPNNLQSTLRNVIAYKAYREAIPFVDVIQTANGFGVVSNANIAPASKERVERLMAQCDQQLDNSIDLLIFKVMADAPALTEWKKFSLFEELTNCLFLTGIDFSGYSSDIAKKRKAFLDAKNDMVTAQSTVLAPLISQDYLDELILQNRDNAITVENKLMLTNCKRVLALVAEEEDSEEYIRKVLNHISFQLEKYITDYPTYAESAERALRVAPKYVNQKTDKTFFFGM